MSLGFPFGASKQPYGPAMRCAPQFLRLQNCVRRLRGHKTPFFQFPLPFLHLHTCPSHSHTMSTLEIDVPAAHSIFFTPYGETYTPSVSGAISLPSACFTTAPLVSVSLTQFVTLSTKRGAIPQLVLRKKQPEATYAEVVACADIVRPTGATTANERDHQALSLDFSLAVPTSLSPTTHTRIMTTSYALIVHATTEGGDKLEAIRELQICRTMALGTPLVFEHFRKFQRMPFSTRLFLAPENLPNCTPKGIFNGDFLLEGPLVQRGRRPSEIKVVVVRELRWSVAEAVEISHKHPSSPPLGADPDKRHIGTICEGRVRGNWMPEDLVSWKEDKDAFKQVQVPFRLLAEKATSDMELHCPQPKRSPRTSTVVNEMSHEKIGIFVSHRLKLEIVIGEDTYVQRTQTLVDRKPIRHRLGAIYPLHIGHVAYDAPITEGMFEAESELPGYEDSGMMPPSYDV